MKKQNFFVKLITPILGIILISSNLIVAQLSFSDEISNLSATDQTTYNNENSNWNNRNIESNLESALTTYKNILSTNPTNRTLAEKLSYGYWLKAKYIDSTAANKYSSWFNALTYSIDCLNLNATYSTSKDINDLTASDYTCAVIKALVIKDFLISYGESIYPTNESMESLDISDDNSQTYIQNLTKLNSGLTESELKETDDYGELVYWREIKALATEAKELVESVNLFSGSIDENNYYYLKNQLLGTYYSKTPKNYGQNLIDSKTNFEVATNNGTDFLENTLEYAINYANYNDKSLYSTLLTTIVNTDISTLNSDLIPENTLTKAYASTLLSEIDTSYGCLNDYDCDSIITSQDCNDNYSSINVVSENITINGNSYLSCDLAVIKLILDLNPDNSISSNSDIINQGTQEWSNNRLKELTLTNYSLAGDLPNEIDILNKLEILNLSSNSITSITDNIANLSSLSSLNLNQNNITNFNLKITNLANIESLELNNNNISSEIPIEIQYLTNIKLIDLSFNEITNEIPNTILNLHNLVTLKLNDNNISGEIPIQANMWSNIKNIYLQNNLLTGNIPFNIFDLVTVENLDLSCNRLRDYFGTFSEQETISLGQQDCE